MEKQKKGPETKKSPGPDLKKKVLAAMKKAGQPVRPGDLAQQLGMDAKEVSKIIAELKNEGAVTSPKRCFWAPA